MYPTVKAVEDYVDAATSGMVTDVSGKADKLIPATAGNVAILDATGNLADGGTLGILAKAAPGACSNGSAKCVLTYNNSIFEWEVVAR
jgi:hypothetical protein